MQVATIILAAGQGTRMKSRLPKVLHQAHGRALLSWALDAATEAVGPNSPTVVVVGHGREQVIAHLARAHPQVQTAVQAEQKGTGHAVAQALPALAEHDGAVVILYGDCPLFEAASIKGLVEVFVAAQSKGAVPLALITTALAEPRGYGRIVRDAAGRFLRIVEEKDATADERRITEVNPGVYIVSRSFLARALAGLRPQNAQGELYLTDIVATAVAEGHDVPSIHVDAAQTLGVNDRVQLAEASLVLKRRTHERAMRGGVTLVDSASAWIGADVTFGTDVEIGAHVVLQGKTHIADGARIGHGAVLTDTRVEASAVIQPYSVCDGAEVGPNAVVGPFARLRPEAVLEAEAHVGNFVELKKTRLGKGSKANHLAYLGDAIIGSGTNVGAGTITCNYDGFGKYVTAMGDGVFVGSNSTLVAPLNIGNGAYIAAGSIVTTDVAADALAVARAKQDNKDGYAPRLRARAKSRADAAKAAKGKS